MQTSEHKRATYRPSRLNQKAAEFEKRKLCATRYPLPATRFEEQRWGNAPACVHCGSVEVYKITDAKTGQRNRGYLWRRHDCKDQYTVRIGTVYEESRLPVRHWAYAFWRACTSKKGVAALEIKRHCQISYKSALFLMNRIRFGMAPDHALAPRLQGTVECDETYVGGKPRFGEAKGRTGRGTTKTPVSAAVQRNGQIRRRIVADVTAETLRAAMKEVIDPRARIMTDDIAAHKGIAARCHGGHETVKHGDREYVRGDVHTNTAESSSALVKRGMMGISTTSARNIFIVTCGSLISSGTGVNLTMEGERFWQSSHPNASG